MAVPPTVADLDLEVSERCGLTLADAGLFLRALDGQAPVTPAIRQGLRRGMKAVGATPADPMKVQDSDVAALSPFAIERILDEAELFALQVCLSQWWRVTQAHKEATSTAARGDGWLEDQRQAVKARVSELKAECEKPYREPCDPVVVSNRPIDLDRRPPLGLGPWWAEGWW